VSCHFGVDWEAVVEAPGWWKLGTPELSFCRHQALMKGVKGVHVVKFNTRRRNVTRKIISPSTGPKIRPTFRYFDLELFGST
jgi:hypothetical protein